MPPPTLQSADDVAHLCAQLGEALFGFLIVTKTELSSANSRGDRVDQISCGASTVETEPARRNRP